MQLICPCTSSLAKQYSIANAISCVQFAVSTATIVSGAVAERVKFVAYGL